MGAHPAKTRWHHRFAVHEIMGAIVAGLGLLMTIGCVILAAMGTLLAPWFFVVPFLAVWLLAGFTMAIPVLSQRSSGIRVREEGRFFPRRQIAWEDISEFIVTSKAEDLTSEFLKAPKTEEFGAGRSILVVKLRDGRRVPTEFQSLGKESPFAPGPDGEESPGFYWQPARKFDNTVIALRAALAAHRSSPAEG
ncbi:hypothetical protein [Amycolatopsis sp. lyj-90]|uniref:hypothetical protein n=1 Tax=Amycolatopsis sp. lyj-90 TaxID=2789285 RepID=UPI00397C9B59